MGRRARSLGQRAWVESSEGRTDSQPKESQVSLQETGEEREPQPPPETPPGEPGTMPEEPGTAPEAPTMPEEPDLAPQESPPDESNS